MRNVHTDTENDWEIYEVRRSDEVQDKSMKLLEDWLEYSTIKRNESADTKNMELA
jgi:hypothetical protein